MATNGAPINSGENQLWVEIATPNANTKTKFPTASIANRAADRLPVAVPSALSDCITATSDGRRQSS